MAATNHPASSPGIMVFRPTMQEFKDFSAYITKMEECGAHKYGIAKVIPPKEWYASKSYDMDKIGDLVIDSPIAQLVTGQQGLYQQFNIQQKPLTVKELKELAESEKHRPPDGDAEKIERAYWKNITFNPPIYGADVAGSIYDSDVKCWNINHLNTILDLIENEKNVKILGVNTAYLYFGMWKTSFAWHTEDMDLYSINYLHFGASKSWYAIPPEHGKRLETLAAGFFPGSAKTCSQFLRHKMTVISPSMLKKYSIPFYKMTQNAGEFMITFPYGFHSGFNQGFNCAESTNFASLRWIDFGKKAKPCTCREDNVKIEMSIFVKKYQPKQYKEYIESLGRKKTSSTEQIEDEKRIAVKKPEKKIKVKRYNRYPSLSGVQSIAKQVKKVADDGKNQRNLKVQKQQVIKKAKDILKKAEKARRVSIGKKKLEGTNKIHDISQKFGSKPMNQKRMTIKTDKSPTISMFSTIEPNKATTNGSSVISELEMSERMRKLLEIKAEMEREIRMKEDRLQNVKAARAKRHELREVKQKLRTRERLPKSRMSGIKKVQPMNPSEGEGLEKEKGDQIQEVKEKAPMPINKPVEVLDGLRVNEPVDIRREISYNQMLSKYGKCCAVCAYFDHEMAHEMLTGSYKSSSNVFNDGPMRSAPLIPELCFMRVSANSPTSSELPTSIPPLTNKESALLTCRACCVTVHQSCYGVSEDTFDPLNWYCNRCQPTLTGIPAIKPVKCELCPLRGGAFKPTSSNRWAHIVCAIAFYDVSFLSPKRRELIELSSLNSARTKLKCIYCSKAANSKTTYGACVQCMAGKCAQSFHVTCSFHNGVSLYAGDWPLTVELYCNKHDKAKLFKNGKRLLVEIQLDDTVYAKHKNGRYYKGKVESIDSSTYYYVVFEDGSFCHDLPPEDILNYSPGTVYSNEDNVDVLWTDGIVYPSVVKSHEVIQRFEVIFEDGSILFLKRSDIYREDEDLPKKIRSKLSYATETANLLWQPSNIRESPTRKAKIEQKKIAKLL